MGRFECWGNANELKALNLNVGEEVHGCTAYSSLPRLYAVRDAEIAMLFI